MTEHATEAEARFRRAAIDFLLTVGEIDENYYHSTSEAITDLAQRGVDYDSSTTPTFGTVELGEGGTGYSGESVQAYTATIVPKGASSQPYHRREKWVFYVPPEVLAKYPLPELVTLLAADDASGTRNWKDRFR